MDKETAAKISKLQADIYAISDACWACGRKMDMTDDHNPAKAFNPKLWIKIPMCRECHKKKTHNHDYTGRERQCIRRNLKNIARAMDNIKRKIG